MVTARFLKNVMTKKVVTVESHRTILEAARIMNETMIGCLPVLEGGKVVGIVTERDVLRKRDFTEFRCELKISKTYDKLDSSLKINMGIY